MKEIERKILYIVIIALLWWIFTEKWAIATYFIGLIMGILSSELERSN